MSILFHLFLPVIASPAAPAPRTCAEEIRAVAVADRLADLPQEIVEHLRAFNRNDLGDSNGPLLDTDAPPARERDHPTARFHRGYKVGDQWFVQLEVAMFSGVRTIVYKRMSGDNKYHREPWKYYSGPPCESIKASLSGVLTPGS